MASDSPAEKPTHYACKCLNVLITSSKSSPTPSQEGTFDPAYVPVSISDDDIVIMHPQVTVRTTTHVEPIPGTSRYSRYTLLTCLLCGLSIYRVFQTISLEVQGKESILLPTEDWMEHEILKSASGWIQVHKDSLVGDSISQARLSPSYSRSFSLLLPPSSSSPSSPPSSSPPKMDTETSPSDSTEPPAQTHPFELRPLFFPPPFTPSHPIFVHLASMASKESQELRGAAKQRISDFVKAETAGIDAKEQDLKRQVEILWKTYRDHLSITQQELRQQTPNVVRSPVSRSGGFGPSGVGVAMGSSSSVTVRNFDPVPISPVLSPPSSVPRVSALSASMATSTFHHPHANEVRSRSPTHSSGSDGSASSHTLSIHSRSSTLVPDAVPVGGNVLQFKRNINDTINTQASYRYFVNLEEDMARYKRSQEEAMKEQQEAEATKRAQQAGPSQVTSGANPNGKLKLKTVQAARPQNSTEDGSVKHEETTSPRGRDKGKRKVTFDVEPAVMTIKTEEEDAKVEEGVTAEQDSREMVFDMEGEEDTGDLSDIRHSTLPLLEQPVSRPFRPGKVRAQNGFETFSSLRPSSLPNPSHIRPTRGQPHLDSSSQVMLPRPKVLTAPTPGDSPSPLLQHGSSTGITSEHDAELLRLVAADTPSHRGAWTPNSRAWQTFTRRQDSKNVGRSRIPEEGDEEREEINFAVDSPPVVTAGQPTDNGYHFTSVSQPTTSGSLPMSILVHKRPHEPLSLSSYRPKTTTPNHPSSSNGDMPSLPHGRKMPSSASIRKAKYAERDQSRSIDPGALDFATTEDFEEEVEADQITHETLASGERGRRQALKILKARSEVPEAGMWRSLA